MEILVRRETADERLAVGATHLDDVDFIKSPVDGLLCMVSIKNGKQVCQQCGGLFDDSHPRLRRAEVSLAPGSPRVILHTKCESYKPRIMDVFRGLEVRRKMAAVARGSMNLVQAAAETGKKIVGG